MTRPALTPTAAELPVVVPFVGPEAIVRATGQPFRVRIGANESGFGAAPSVLEAISRAVPDSWKYGDPEVYEVRAAIARHHGISRDEVTIGEGVDGLLGLCVRLFAGPGDLVVTTLGGYPTFNYHVIGHGATLHGVPYANGREDLDGLLGATRRLNPKIVYLANPDNPLGSWWPAADVMAFAAALPPTTLLILDEAYGEIAPPGTMPPLDTSIPNVLRMRTFSKAYGLAGMRCGYAIGERSLIRDFERVRNHFGVSSLAQTAAIAALADQTYLTAVVGRIIAARTRIAAIAEANGLRPLPSATNFVTIDCGRDSAYALAVLKALQARGIFIRKPGTPPFDTCIRISAGPPADLDILQAELPAALAAAR